MMGSDSGAWGNTGEREETEIEKGDGSGGWAELYCSVYITTHIHINQAATVMKVKRTEGRPLVFSYDVSVINYDGVPVNI